MASLYEDYLQLMKDDPALAEEWLNSLDDAEVDALLNQSTQKKGLRQHAPAYSTVENPRQENPDISWQDRLGVKNLGNASSLESLKKLYPNLMFDRNSKGQIVYRRTSGDPNIYVLDPDKPELLDIADSGRDIAQGTLGGLAQGVVTTATGLATKNPVVTLGAGATAAGATEAGVDYLSQKIGEWLGYNEGANLTDAAIAGGFGMASSFLPGNPFTAGQAKKLYQAGINPSEFGRPIQTGVRNTVDRFGHLAGAPDKPTMQLGRRKMKDVVALEKQYDDPLKQETKAFKQDLENSLSGMEQETWANIDAAIKSAQEPVDLREPRNLLNQWIGELQAKKKKVGLSGPEGEELARLQDLRSKHFFLEREVAVPPEMTGHPDIPLPGGPATPATELTPRFKAGPTPAEVRDLNAELKSYVDYAKSDKAIGDVVAQKMSVRVKKLRAAVGESIEKAVPEVKALNEQYRKIQRHRENLYASGFVDQGARRIDDYTPEPGELSEAFTKRDERAMDTMRRGKSVSAKDSIKQIDEFLEQTGDPSSFGYRAETLEAANTWMHPSKVGDVKGAGTKETARLLTGAMQPSIAGGVLFTPVAAAMFPDNPLMSGMLGGGMGFATGAAVNKAMSPAMQRKYIRSSQAVRDLVDKFGPAPLIGSKAATQSLLNPWGEPE